MAPQSHRSRCCQMTGSRAQTNQMPRTGPAQVQANQKQSAAARRLRVQAHQRATVLPALRASQTQVYCRSRRSRQTLPELEHCQKLRRRQMVLGPELACCGGRVVRVHSGESYE